MPVVLFMMLSLYFYGVFPCFMTMDVYLDTVRWDTLPPMGTNVVPRN